jgi:hypothetical protein
MGIEFDRFLEHLHAIHLRHAVIHKQERHALIPPQQAAQEIQSRLAGVSTQHAIPLFVVLFQVTLDSSENVWIVIDCQYDGFLHIAISQRSCEIEQQ